MSGTFPGSACSTCSRSAPSGISAKPRSAMLPTAPSASRRPAMPSAPAAPFNMVRRSMATSSFCAGAGAADSRGVLDGVGADYRRHLLGRHERRLEAEEFHALEHLGIGEHAVHVGIDPPHE